jgi:hypothetical protein
LVAKDADKLEKLKKNPLEILNFTNNAHFTTKFVGESVFLESLEKIANNYAPRSI